MVEAALRLLLKAPKPRTRRLPPLPSFDGGTGRGMSGGEDARFAELWVRGRGGARP